MGKGKLIDEETREIIFKVYRYFASEANKFKRSPNSNYFNKVQIRVAKATGVSQRTIYNLLKARDISGPLDLKESSRMKRSGNDSDESEEDTNLKKPGSSRRRKLKTDPVQTYSKDDPPPLIPLSVRYIKPDPDSRETDIIGSMEKDHILVKCERDSDSDEYC